MEYKQTKLHDITGLTDDEYAVVAFAIRYVRDSSSISEGTRLTCESISRNLGED